MNQRPAKIQALRQLFVFICVTVFCGKVEAGKKQSSSTIVIHNNGGNEEEEVTHNVIPIPFPVPYRVMKHQSHLIPLHQPPPMGMTRSPPMMFSGTSHQPSLLPLGITTHIPMALTQSLPPHQKFHNFLALRMEPIGTHQFHRGYSSIPAPPSIDGMDPKMINFYSLYKPWPPAITVPRTTVQYDRPPTIQPNDDYKQGDELETERNPPDEYPQEYYPDEYVNENGPKAGDIRTHPPQEYPENEYNKGNEIDDYHREYEKDYPPADPNAGVNNDHDYRVNDIEHNPPQAPVPPSPPIPDMPPEEPPQSPPPSNSMEDERDAEYNNGEYTNEYYDEPKNSPEYYTTRQSNSPSSVPPPSRYSSTVSGNIPEIIEYSYGADGIDPGIEYLEDIGLEQNNYKKKPKKSKPKKMPEYSGKFAKNYDYYTEKPYIKSLSNRIPSEEIIDYGLNYNRGIPQAEFDDPVYSLKDNYEYLGYRDANRRSFDGNKYYRDDEDEYQQVENRYWSSNGDSRKPSVFGQRIDKYKS